MRAVTETELRDAYKKAEFTSYTLPEGSRLTPAAAQFLSERRIPVHTATEVKDHPIEPAKNEVYAREQISGKPEHMTHLNGKNLVIKNHPRIKFRGKIDTFEAHLINGILEVQGLGYQELGRDLKDVLAYTRQILRAEVLDEPLPPLYFNGWSGEEIRERSHHPQKYFGVGHLTPNPEHGALMGKLNFLRTQAREVELVAMNAFIVNRETVEREDILQSLNRLSSLLYIMMIQLVSGHYRVGC